jgi:predicted 3-demethylubiquinone-9 3-methyltransferase (glyoxalase superfamily)
MLKIAPCLWFDDQAEAAAEFYTSVFKNSKILSVTRYPNAGQEVHGRPAGSVMTVNFELDGQTFTGLNGGPLFKFNEAISFQVDCKTQEEIDYFWEALSAGGKPGPCGWLKDKFGMSWQIVSNEQLALQLDPDPVKAARLMNAVMKMTKPDIAGLRKAYEGK